MNISLYGVKRIYIYNNVTLEKELRLEISPYGRGYYSIDIARSRFPKTTRRTHYSEYGQMSTSVECGPDNSYPRPRKVPSSSVYIVTATKSTDAPHLTASLVAPPLKRLSALISSTWVACPDRDGQSVNHCRPQAWLD